MTDSLKAAAKAGDIKALEALMNKSFESKGVTVRVTNSGALLKIVVRGKEAPDKALLPTIQKGLASITPKGYEQAIATARAIGKADAWSHKWDLPRDTQAESLPVSATSTSSPAPKPTVKVFTSSKKSKSWYQKNWLVISLLILFPFAGIPLVWMSEWPRRNKIGASTASGLWILLSFLTQLVPETQPRVVQEDPQTPTAELAVAEEEQVEVPSPTVDRTFADAVNSAMAASKASQQAYSKDEWDKVSELWDVAISQMRKVPLENSNYSTAQLKVVEYQRNLDYAKQKSIALSPNLGISTAELISVFSQADVDFSFKDSPLADGTPRLMGTSPDGFTIIEIYDSSGNVNKAVMMTFLGKDHPTDMLGIVYNLALLKRVAPGYDWVEEIKNAMIEIRSSSTDKKNLLAGDRAVSISLQEIQGVEVLFVSVEPQ